MSKTIPASFEAPQALRYATAQPILASNAIEIAEAQHFNWSNAARSALVLGIFDPVAQTTSATYSRTMTVGRDLHEFSLVNPAMRLTKNGSSLAYRITLGIVGQDIQVRLTVQAVTGGTALTAVASAGFGGGLYTANEAELVFTTASTPLVLRYKLEAKTTSATGYLAELGIAESIIANTTYLPDGA